MPDAAITTDIIAGFPGETEDEFAKSLEFVQEMEFAGGHAFSYSARPGTAAARMAARSRLMSGRRGMPLIGLCSTDQRGTIANASSGSKCLCCGNQRRNWMTVAGRWRGLTGNYLRVVASGLPGDVE